MYQIVRSTKNEYHKPSVVDSFVASTVTMLIDISSICEKRRAAFQVVTNYESILAFCFCAHATGCVSLCVVRFSCLLSTVSVCFVSCFDVVNLLLLTSRTSVLASTSFPALHTHMICCKSLITC